MTTALSDMPFGPEHSEDFTEVLEFQKRGQLAKCRLLTIGFFVFFAMFILIAAPVVIEIVIRLANNRDILEAHLRGNLLGLLGVIGPAAMTLFFLWIGAEDCLRHLEASLIAARRKNAALSMRLYEGVSCVGPKSKSGVIDTLKALAGF